jgi:hypothetical protein
MTHYRKRLLCTILFCIFVASESGIAAQGVPPDTRITLDRTVCFGSCPSYKLTIDAKGGVVFEGRNFVKEKGRRTGQMSPSMVESLVKQFREIAYFELDDSYSGNNKACTRNATDHPTATTSIRLDGRVKSVEHYHGCRGAKILEKLTELENAIDEAAGTSQWIR